MLIYFESFLTQQVVQVAIFVGGVVVGMVIGMMFRRKQPNES